MSDTKSNRVLAFIKGRSDRKQYWLAVVLLVVGNIVLAGVQMPALIVSAISMPFWLVIAGRRLHDFNRRWFWALIPLCSGFAFGFIQGLINSTFDGDVFPPQAEATFYIAVTLIVSVAIGSVPGSRSANRYGPPAPVKRATY